MRKRGAHDLVVGFLFQPAAGVPTEVESTDLVVDEDGNHEWQGRKPPYESGKGFMSVSYGINRIGRPRMVSAMLTLGTH